MKRLTIILLAIMLGLVGSASPVTAGTLDQDDQPVPAWVYDPVDCDVDARSEDELIALGENPPDDLAFQGLPDGDAAAITGDSSDTTDDVTYDDFEQPDDPVSDDDFESLQEFLRLFEGCLTTGQGSSLAFTGLMTDDLAGAFISARADEEGLSVEAFVSDQFDTPPESSPSDDVGVVARVLFLPYQAWNVGRNDVVATVGIAFYTNFTEYDHDELEAVVPNPADVLTVIAITLDHDGGDWAWSDLNARVDPESVEPR